MTIQSSDNKNIEEFGWIGDIQAKIRAAAAKAAAQAVLHPSRALHLQLQHAPSLPQQHRRTPTSPQAQATMATTLPRAHHGTSKKRPQAQTAHLLLLLSCLPTLLRTMPPSDIGTICTTAMLLASPLRVSARRP